MQMLAFQFDSQIELESAVALLWEKAKITGEMVTRQMPGGDFRLDLTAEKPVRESVLAKLAAYQIDSKDS